MSVKEYFKFTKRERIAILGLTGILLIIAIVPRIFSRAPQITRIEADSLLDAKVSALNINGVDSSVNGAPMTFTPRSNRKAASDGHYKNKGPSYSQGKWNRRNFEVKVIEINSADTTSWIALPWIGSKLAARIVLFREKLGGFYRVEQVGEVYGLQDSVFQKLRQYLSCDPAKVRQININEINEDALKQHPYIRWKLAKLLTAYRSQHGTFSSVDALRDVEGFDDSVMHKIRPYLRCQ